MVPSSPPPISMLLPLPEVVTKRGAIFEELLCISWSWSKLTVLVVPETVPETPNYSGIVCVWEVKLLV